MSPESYLLHDSRVTGVLNTRNGNVPTAYKARRAPGGVCDASPTTRQAPKRPSRRSASSDSSFPLLCLSVSVFFYLSFLDIFLNYFLSVSFFLFLSMSFPLSLPMFVSLFFLLSIRPCLSLSSPTPLSILSHLNCWYSAVGLLELVLQICHLLQLTFHPLHFWPNS